MECKYCARVLPATHSCRHCNEPYCSALCARYDGSYHALKCKIGVSSNDARESPATEAPPSQEERPQKQKPAAPTTPFEKHAQQYSREVHALLENHIRQFNQAQHRVYTTEDILHQMQEAGMDIDMNEEERAEFDLFLVNTTGRPGGGLLKIDRTDVDKTLHDIRESFTDYYFEHDSSKLDQVRKSSVRLAAQLNGFDGRLFEHKEFKKNLGNPEVIGALAADQMIKKLLPKIEVDNVLGAIMDPNLIPILDMMAELCVNLGKEDPGFIGNNVDEEIGAMSACFTGFSKLMETFKSVARFCNWKGNKEVDRAEVDKKWDDYMDDIINNPPPQQPADEPQPPVQPPPPAKPDEKTILIDRMNQLRDQLKAESDKANQCITRMRNSAVVQFFDRVSDFAQSYFISRLKNDESEIKKRGGLAGYFKHVSEGLSDEEKETIAENKTPDIPEPSRPRGYFNRIGRGFYTLGVAFGALKGPVDDQQLVTRVVGYYATMAMTAVWDMALTGTTHAVMGFVSTLVLNTKSITEIIEKERKGRADAINEATSQGKLGLANPGELLEKLQQAEKEYEDKYKQTCDAEIQQIIELDDSPVIPGCDICLHPDPNVVFDVQVKQQFLVNNILKAHETCVQDRLDSLALGLGVEKSALNQDAIKSITNEELQVTASFLNDVSKATSSVPPDYDSLSADARPSAVESHRSSQLDALVTNPRYEQRWKTFETIEKLNGLKDDTKVGTMRDKANEINSISTADDLARAVEAIHTEAFKQSIKIQSDNTVYTADREKRITDLTQVLQAHLPRHQGADLNRKTVSQFLKDNDIDERVHEKVFNQMDPTAAGIFRYLDDCETNNRFEAATKENQAELSDHVRKHYVGGKEYAKRRATQSFASRFNLRSTAAVAADFTAMLILNHTLSHYIGDTSFTFLMSGYQLTRSYSAYRLNKLKEQENTYRIVLGENSEALKEVTNLRVLRENQLAIMQNTYYFTALAAGTAYGLGLTRDPYDLTYTQGTINVVPPVVTDPRWLPAWMRGIITIPEKMYNYGWPGYQKVWNDVLESGKNTGVAAIMGMVAMMAQFVSVQANWWWKSYVVMPMVIGHTMAHLCAFSFVPNWGISAGLLGAWLTGTAAIITSNILVQTMNNLVYLYDGTQYETKYKAFKGFFSAIPMNFWPALRAGFHAQDPVSYSMVPVTQILDELKELDSRLYKLNNPNSQKDVYIRSFWQKASLSRWNPKGFMDRHFSTLNYSFLSSPYVSQNFMPYSLNAAMESNDQTFLTTNGLIQDLVNTPLFEPNMKKDSLANRIWSKFKNNKESYAQGFMKYWMRDVGEIQADVSDTIETFKALDAGASECLYNVNRKRGLDLYKQITQIDNGGVRFGFTPREVSTVQGICKSMSGTNANTFLHTMNITKIAVDQNASMSQ